MNDNSEFNGRTFYEEITDFFQGQSNAIYKTKRKYEAYPLSERELEYMATPIDEDYVTTLDQSIYYTDDMSIDDMISAMLFHISNAQNSDSYEVMLRERNTGLMELRRLIHTKYGINTEDKEMSVSYTSKRTIADRLTSAKKKSEFQNNDSQQNYTKGESR